MKRHKLFYALLFLLGVGGSAQAVEPKTESLMNSILNHYLVIQEKLAADTTTGIEAEAQGIVKKVSEFFNKPCKPEELSCAGLLQKIPGAAAKIKGNDIQSIRKGFQELSETMIAYWKDFKPNWPNVFAFRCPMANENKGAPWLQKGTALQNPYFGKAMSSCGTPLQK